MTQLDCNATECRYNEGRLCCRTGITVEGSSAMKMEETYCGNYEVGKDGTCINAVGEPDGRTEITCDACSCRYNKQAKCSAGSVDIISSDGVGQTACGSFQVK